MQQTFGTNPDGTLSICRAKPENKGKGRCNHSEHYSFDTTEYTKDDIQKFNEEQLEKKYGKTSRSLKLKATRDHTKSNTPKLETTEELKTTIDGTTIRREDFDKGVNKVSESFRDDDWKFIQDFYEQYSKRIGYTQIASRFENAADNIHDYLQSDDKIAVKMREYLGKEIDLKNLSRILTYEVKSMTMPTTWKNGKALQVRRIIMTTFNNDMNKNRYVASVLFFGGRCCYCNVALTKDKGPNQASGEHITPVSPENENDPRGSTRFGNMVLACVACNNARGNKELHDWLSKTNRVEKENKQNVLSRIQKFREYTLYNEYDEKENEMIDKYVEEAYEYIEKINKVDHKYYSAEDTEKIKDKLKVVCHDLRETLRKRE